MTAADKKKAQILVLLILIAGGVWFFIYQYGGATGKQAAAQSAAATKGKGKKGPKAMPDARIRKDLIESAAVADGVGQKNIFQYRQKPLPPPPPAPPRALPAVTSVPLPPPTSISSTPIQPQMKTFRYDGYSSLSGRMIASLTEGTNTWQVREGECLMGTYCIRRITESLVEIEDTQLKQRRSFTRTQ